MSKTETTTAIVVMVTAVAQLARELVAWKRDRSGRRRKRRR